MSTEEENTFMTVGQLREVLANHPDDMPVILDSNHEESCAYYLRDAIVEEVQEADPESEYADEVTGDVGYKNWLNDNTPEFDALWLTHFGPWKG